MPTRSSNVPPIDWDVDHGGAKGVHLSASQTGVDSQVGLVGVPDSGRITKHPSSKRQKTESRPTTADSGRILKLGRPAARGRVKSGKASLGSFIEGAIRSRALLRNNQSAPDAVPSNDASIAEGFAAVTGKRDDTAELLKSLPERIQAAKRPVDRHAVPADLAARAAIVQAADQARRAADAARAAELEARRRAHREQARREAAERAEAARLAALGLNQYSEQRGRLRPTLAPQRPEFRSRLSDRELQSIGDAKFEAKQREEKGPPHGSRASIEGIPLRVDRNALAAYAKMLGARVTPRDSVSDMFGKVFRLKPSDEGLLTRGRFNQQYLEHMLAAGPSEARRAPSSYRDPLDLRRVRGFGRRQLQFAKQIRRTCNKSTHARRR